MYRITTDDTEICYGVTGSGPPVVLLHPFPANHELWQPIARMLSSRYRMITPDLRGHGESSLGTGPATIQKHAFDIAHIMDAAGADRAALIGVSIGGYAIFEFWRRFRDRVTALVLCNTKAQADTPEARANRLQTADDVLQRGTEPFFERMMRKISAENVAGVQRGMADRPDSVPTLKTITVPTLIITGDEDIMTGLPEAELMKQNISGSQMKVIAKAGHYSPWEQPQEVGRLLRGFLDSTYRV